MVQLPRPAGSHEGLRCENGDARRSEVIRGQVPVMRYVALQRVGRKHISSLGHEQCREGGRSMSRGKDPGGLTNAATSSFEYG